LALEGNIKIKASRLSLTILLVTALNYIVYVDHAQFLWPAIEFYATPRGPEICAKGM